MSYTGVNEKNSESLGKWNDMNESNDNLNEQPPSEHKRLVHLKRGSHKTDKNIWWSVLLNLVIAVLIVVFISVLYATQFNNKTIGDQLTCLNLSQPGRYGVTFGVLLLALCYIYHTMCRDNTYTGEVIPDTKAFWTSMEGIALLVLLLFIHFGYYTTCFEY